MTIAYYAKPPKTREEFIRRWMVPIAHAAIDESCGPGDPAELARQQFIRDINAVFGTLP